MTDKIYIILPIYNEGESIYNLLSKYNDFFTNHCSISHEIIAINDFSTDNTENWILKSRDEFGSLNINYIKHEKNKGLEGALYTGFLLVNELLDENDIVVTMDSDDTHNPYLIGDMLDKINQGADIVIASRYCKQSKVYGLSSIRAFLSLGARFLYTLKWNIKGVKDYTCGFRAYKSWVAKDSIAHYRENFIQEKGFTVTAELLKKMSIFNPVIVEVPMILTYSNKLNTSNMNVFRTIWLTIEMLSR